ncbi:MULTISPECIES: TetR/AcrR family transcriptional regulator [Microbacterium]|uniref:TetR/AcrR family transcriptional regulator n=1 Tax=Microbacterium wangchenii TaxID=2541726 RepID=A0ABX5SYD7_9MICO|nr:MULTISPECIES: TetR/AcrR family transcriptional regulator [Microbacterium]MCK6067207.1 TetR/AcrR family transcriptional regulator [Microbacterium sp. EYE_512]QBR89840.1 TetR/AcrR family transcriptional regulator [Microbacterium wangchenii]TFV85301.1 TetR/AcrR family transcriptional regulator [Microbacterium sp. dk485]TXK16563.1 TetR/AcrR family transcriptional regulator [Microbacterium wangchenii]
MSETTATTPRGREATRQRLLDAATEVFAEVGLDATSVESVCERAGFTRGAFYSNFASKEEMFLELAASVARSRVSDVEARVAELAGEGALDATPATAVALVERVLDLPGDDRLGVLLMSEIRIHALRNPAMAEAFLEQDQELSRNIARMIGDIARASGLRLALPQDQVAQLLLLVWEGTMTRAVMAGRDRLGAREEVQHALAGVVPLLIAGSD